MMKKNKILWTMTLLLAAAGSCLAQPAVLVTGPQLPGLALGAIAWADYDGDGLDDLLVCGMDSLGAARTVLLHSTGATLLPDPAQNLIQVLKGDAAWGDYDGDGDPDLLLTGETSPGHGATVLYRNTAGVLAPVPTPAIPALSHSRARWADLDGDGDLDLLLAGLGFDDGLVGLIARNDGGGVFAVLHGPAYDTREWPVIAVTDYDGDGLVDIAFSDISPRLREGMRTVLLHNIGGMLFVPAATPSVPGLHGGSLDFADHDGDGRPDLLCSGSHRAAHVGVYRNAGGQWLPAAGGASLPQLGMGEARWGDFDGDGDPDVVVAGMGATGPECWRFVNTGGNLAAAQGPAGMPAIYNVRIALGDWDGDGHLDLAIAGQDADDHPAAYVATWNPGLQTFKF
jgi:hypothetical protein